MIIASQDAAIAGNAPQSADFLARFAETMRAESGIDLRHAYFVEEARRLLASGMVPALDDRPAPRDPLCSSGCFDAWARRDAA